MSTLFKIQKNVAMPSAARDPASVARKYPYNDMEIGDFFFVPGKDKNTLSSHASAAGKRLGKRFSTRLVHAVEAEGGYYELCDANEVGAVQGIGVWRDEDPKPGEAPAPVPSPEDDGEDADL